MIVSEKPLLYTRFQAKERLCLGLRTLDWHLAKGNIGCVRIGGKVMFRDCDFDAFIARHAVAPRELAGAI